MEKKVEVGKKLDDLANWRIGELAALANWRTGELELANWRAGKTGRAGELADWPSWQNGELVGRGKKGRSW